MDRRVTFANDQVAHVSLKGDVDAPRFSESRCAVATCDAEIWSAPRYAQTRSSRVSQLLFGETVQVLDCQSASAFVQCDRDGYVGWVLEFYLQDSEERKEATHWVSARASHRYRAPDIKADGNVWPLSLGSRLAVEEVEGDFARIWCPQNCDANRESFEPEYVPISHVSRLTDLKSDPASVAEQLYAVPYLWGGNTSFGIDCSGLVQLCLTACGVECPRDSDMQEAAFPHIDPLDRRRGDLVFWKGHVGMLLDHDTLIHANAHHMSVETEPLNEAIARIAKKEFGAVTAFARPPIPLFD